MIKEFGKFIMRGNVLDLAVGIIIGAAFTSIVNSLVTDIISPLIGLLTGQVDFSAVILTVGAAEIRVGAFLNAVINFLIVAFVVFMIVRTFNTAMERMRRKEETAPTPAAPDPMLEGQKKLTEAIEALNTTMKSK